MTTRHELHLTKEQEEAKAAISRIFCCNNLHHPTTHRIYTTNDNTPHLQVTRHELHLTKEQEEAEAAEAAKQRQLAARREVDEASYSRMVDTENINRWDRHVGRGAWGREPWEGREGLGGWVGRGGWWEARAGELGDGLGGEGGGTGWGCWLEAAAVGRMHCQGICFERGGAWGMLAVQCGAEGARELACFRGEILGRVEHVDELALVSQVKACLISCYGAACC